MFQQCRNDISARNPAKVRKEDAGRLLYLSGTLSTEASIRDPDFPLAVKAVEFTRTVQMFQWVEESHEYKQYHYVTRWVDKPVDSSKFNRNNRDQFEDNPSTMSYRGHEFSHFHSQAPGVRLGNISLPEDIVTGYCKEYRDTLPIPQKTFDAIASLYGQEYCHLSDTVMYLYQTANRVAPEIGDLRFSYGYVPTGKPITLVGTVDQDLRFVPFLTPTKHTIFMYDYDRVSLDDLAAMTHETSKAGGIFLGWVIIFTGVFWEPLFIVSKKILFFVLRLLYIIP